MRTVRFAPALAAALLVLGAAAAAPPAAASTPGDCSVTRHNRSTVSVTCTNRPAGTTWRAYITACHSGWVDTDAYGPVITGNGTSTATCPLNSAALPPTVYLPV